MAKTKVTIAEKGVDKTVMVAYDEDDNNLEWGGLMQELDFQWFLDHYNNIFDKYGHSYVAIKNQQILGSYSSYAEAVHTTEKTEPIGTFIVQHCTGDESGYTNFIASMNFFNS